MSRAASFLRSNIPLLGGFGVGLGLNTYVNKYRHNEPEWVKESSVLRYFHDGVIYLDDATSWAIAKIRESTSSPINLPELGHKAASLFEEGKAGESAEVVTTLASRSDEWKETAENHFLPGLCEVVPKLQEEGLIAPLTFLVMVALLGENPDNRDALAEKCSEAAVTEAMKLLKDKSSHERFGKAVDALAAKVLYTMAVSAKNINKYQQEREEFEKKKGRKWWSWGGGKAEAPEDDVVRQALQEGVLPLAIESLRTDGPDDAESLDMSLLLITIAQVDGVKKMVQSGMTDVVVQRMVRSMSTLGPSDSPRNEKSMHPAWVHVNFQLLSLLIEGGGDLKNAPHKELIDGVFRGVAENETVPGIQLLGYTILQHLLPYTDKTWLAQKGVVPLVTKSLMYCGSQPSVRMACSGYLEKVLADDSARGEVRSEDLEALNQVTVILQEDFEERDEDE
eukprot:Sspe_Gene.55207::Locus_30388_Transcript_1_1_Confidence_1.000_Length_1422::g.55207::m.55207